jgi:hypothetical protein
MSDEIIDRFETEECPSCPDSGVIYLCVEEWACADPEGGCNYCRRPCSWCAKPRRAEAEL